MVSIIDKVLDAIEGSLHARKNSELRRTREMLTRHVVERERKQARGEAFEEAFRMLATTDVKERMHVELKGLAESFAQSHINLAHALIESGAFLTDPKIRFGKLKGPALRMLNVDAEWDGADAIRIEWGGKTARFTLDELDR